MWKLRRRGSEIHEAFRRWVQDPDGPILRFERVSFWIDPDDLILEDVSFEVGPGKSFVILGASGAGKSTLLRLALGLMKPMRGRIWLDGFDITILRERDLIELRQQMGIVFQEGALFDSLTLEENVMFPLVERLRMPTVEAQRRTQEVLEWVDLMGHERKLPAELSGGMRRRAGIARALVTEPCVLFYDEPTAGLDPITARTIIDLIVKLRDVRGVTSIVVTHKLEDAFRIATTRWVQRDREWHLEERPLEDNSVDTMFMVLYAGRVVFYGNGQALRQADHPYVRAFLGQRPPKNVITESFSSNSAYFSP